MKKLMTIVAVMLFAAGMRVHGAEAARPRPEDVYALTKRVADWQIRTFENQQDYRALSAKIKEQTVKNTNHTYLKKWHDLAWHNGALYAGMNQWRQVTDDRKYVDWLVSIGERNGWNLHNRPYHADDHAVGQFYLALYRERQKPEMLKPARERFDWILANRKTGTLMWGKDTDCHDRWGWCDALFMAPPVWARMAAITGERKYLDFMYEEYMATCNLLWDKEDHLFWRDSSFFERREANGRKLYWARGNGWVFGGLALMIPDLPGDWEHRSFFVDLYRQMAATLKKVQRADGTWSMGVLGGVESYPLKETSGTSFFTFGLAWGINNGVLDRGEFEPVVLKAWNALSGCVADDGMLVWVQPVGAAPGESYPDKSEVYGVGAFLAAGTEMYKLLKP